MIFGLNHLDLTTKGTEIPSLAIDRHLLVAVLMIELQVELSGVFWTGLKVVHSHK